jgi:hypothetical protein
MTQAITSRHLSRLLSHLAAWTARPLERLSDRIHAGGEAIARENGWEITRATGRFGLGARTYHDPRFSQRAPANGHSGQAQHHYEGDREEATHVRDHPGSLR